MTDISTQELDRFRELGSTLCLDALRTLGYYRVYVEGAQCLTGIRMAGLAVTLRMLPERPDFNEDIASLRDNSAEYRAMESCDEKSVLVIDGMGWKHDSVGGEIKFLRLRQKEARGIVTDASIRDVASLKEYGLGIYADSQTAKAGPLSFQPAEQDIPIQCGGALVIPGDVVVGDDAGVVIVPRRVAGQVLEIAEERLELEQYIVQQLETFPRSPGHFYPINAQVQNEFREWKRRQEK